MRIYPICIVPFPLNPFFSMVLVRLYGNSWKWQLLRRCFAEWIIRMDQFGEMSKTKQVVHAETSRSGASGNRTFYTQFNYPAQIVSRAKGDYESSSRAFCFMASNSI